MNCLPLNYQPSEGIISSQYFYSPLNFQPNEGMSIDHNSLLLNSQPSKRMGVNTLLKLFLVWLYFSIRICARFRSTPKHGGLGPNLPLNLIFSAFFLFHFHQLHKNIILENVLLCMHGVSYVCCCMVKNFVLGRWNFEFVKLFLKI